MHKHDKLQYRPFLLRTRSIKHQQVGLFFFFFFLASAVISSLSLSSACQASIFVIRFRFGI